MVITLGEYIAGGNAMDFSRYFKAQGDDILAATYQKIAEDEFRHFALLKSVANGCAKIPKKLREIYKGKLLSQRASASCESIFERMAVMHTVFEGAAFAHMSLLSKCEFLDDRYAGLQKIAKIIMIDEARHMSEGFAAINSMRTNAVSSEIVDKIRINVQRHVDEIREAPSLTFGEESDFTNNLYKLYDENVGRNMKRVFG